MSNRACDRLEFRVANDHNLLAENPNHDVQGRIWEAGWTYSFQVIPVVKCVQNTPKCA